MVEIFLVRCYLTNLGAWKIPDDVDIVMTHGPPHAVLDSVAEQGGKKLGCEALLKEVQRVKPLMHCFGHVHGGYGYKVQEWSCWGDAAERDVETSQAGTAKPMKKERLARGESTLMVNAAIMDEDYRPKNAPWVVALPL
ncbi:hypothetical protein BST61_g511 [Cercospora zeina]